MAATDPPPSRSGLRSLDAVNLFLAGALSGFGPYIAVFLAEQKWTQQNIGFVLTAGGLAGLLSQLPSGELLDAIRSKRVVVASGAIMVATSALIIALCPSFPLVLAALVLQSITGGFLGLAIASISLGLVGHAALGKRLGRNQRFASMGGVIAAGFMGVIGYFLSYRAIFFAAAALVLPLLAALGRIKLSGIDYGRVSGSLGGLSTRARRSSLWKNRELAYVRRLRVFVSAGQCVDAATCRRGAGVQQGGLFFAHRLSVDHCPPGGRGADGIIGGPPCEYLGAPTPSARRIRGLTTPRSGVCLDYQSDGSHRCSDTRRCQWNDVGRAHGLDRC